MKFSQLQLHDPAVILMVDDNEHGLVARKNVLKQQGFDSVTATSAEAGLELLQTHHFDLVVTDYKMGGMDGIAFIGHVRERCPGTPVILLSGFVDALGLDERSTGADAVISKSATEAASLVRTVTRLLTRRPRRKPIRPETRAQAVVVRSIG
jgi:CheY-like chemotaxis protein